MNKPLSIGAKVGGGIACIALAVTLGWLLGGVYGEHRASNSAAAANAEWRNILASDSAGIAVGRKFPSFPVWHSDGVGVVEDVCQLLPKGGILLAVSPSCHVCVDMSLALQRALDEHDKAPVDAVLLLEGESADALTLALREHNVTIPVYWDVKQTLPSEYHVIANPTYFVIDTAGIVMSLGAGMATPDKLEAAITDVLLSSR